MTARRESKAAADPSPGAAKRRWRLGMRLAALAVASILLLGNWPCAWAALLTPSLSPYVAAASAIATRSVGIATLLALPVFCLAIFSPRWFCRHACPTGLLLEMAGRLRARPRAARRRLPTVGRWLVLLTLGGACLGYPLFLWLDPLAIFAAFLNTMGPALGKADAWAAIGLPALLLLGLLWPFGWCRNVCPLGAAQDMLAMPSRALRRRTKRFLCQPQEAQRQGWPLLRRTVLGAGLGAIGAAFLVRGLVRGRARRLRPPGAIGEDAFTGVCVRCGNCASVCPSQIIHPDLGADLDSLLTPTIRYDGAYCLPDCQRCTQVCPSGALRRLTPHDKQRAAIGLPHIDMKVCLLGDDCECSLCRTHCPYDAIRIIFRESDYLSVPQVDPDRCNGCGACQVMCPTQPIKAIVVRP